MHAPRPLPRRRELVGAFESTYLPAHDVDILETSGHTHRWREDLELLRAHGVTRLRYPIRWHRVEPRPGDYDWRATDEVMAHLNAEGFEPIVDLVHHTSYPRWLTGFDDPRFPAAYERFGLAVADRYPWIREYTLFNEPFATLFLAGHEAIWAPYRRGAAGFVGLLRNVLPAISRTSRAFAERLPRARHVWVDSCEGHTGTDAAGAEHAAMANDRRFFVLDAMLGQAGDRSRPFVADVVAAGGADLLELEPAASTSSASTTTPTTSGPTRSGRDASASPRIRPFRARHGSRASRLRRSRRASPGSSGSTASMRTCP